MAGAWSITKWPFPLPQSFGVSKEIRFVKICLNLVRIAEYVGSPEILLMTLRGITAKTLSRKTFVVAIIYHVRSLMPLVFFRGGRVVQCPFSPVTVVNLLDKVC